MSMGSDMNDLVASAQNDGSKPSHWIYLSNFRDKVIRRHTKKLN